jgi:hypothetical protein
MPPKRDLSWLRERRVLAFGIVCAAAGFLLALLIFGEPWHLPPNWGDIPTWLTVLVGAIAAWFVYGQLEQQAQAIREEFNRNANRDKLLAGQLAELADREKSRQREQASHIILTKGAISVKPRPEDDIYGEYERGASFMVANNSHRPIRHVKCRLILDGRTIEAGSFAERRTDAPRDPRMPPFIGGYDPEAVDPSDKSFRTLRAGQTMLASFVIPEDLTSYTQAQLVTQFLDDEDRCWELDTDNRLHPVLDDRW